MGRLIGRRVGEEERGAYAILFAILIVVLFTFTALAVDLAAARAYVRDNRTRVDGAIAAAGNKLATDPMQACLDAWSYLLANTDELRSKVPPPTSPCTSGTPSSFAAAIPCDPDSMSNKFDAVGEEPFQITFTWPVPGDDPELQGDLRSIDGTDPCARFGITIRRNQGALFGGILGPLVNLSSPASAVVRTLQVGETEGVVALLLLDPVGCVALSAQGGGASAGGVKVFPSGATPGFISVDSDGTREGGPDGCGGENVVALDANGSNSNILACGSGSTLPDNCLEDGIIEIFAMDSGQADCSGPDNDACDPDDVPGQVFPQPVSMTERRTRAPVDHRYNCQENYPDYRPRTYVPSGEVPIRDCRDPVVGTALVNDRDLDGFSSDYIDELRAYVGTAGPPVGFTTVTATEFADCRIRASESPVVLAPNNYFINCSNLRVDGDAELEIEGGNVVLAGSLEVNGTFKMNTNPDASTLPDDCLEQPDADDDGRPERPAEICPTSYSADAAYMYVRSGGFTRGTGSIFDLEATAVYFNNGTLNFTAGTGTVRWVAPFEGTFEDLDLWSESSSDHRLTGSAAQELDGVFFTPNAHFIYSGGGSQDQANAQFLTWRMTATGNGVLRMSPDPDRAVLFPLYGYIVIR